ncbi:MAG: oligosaccharide flippase family protein [Castellaniella sp.]|uniref:oligosaccharide flippase family protein n=1 Tax=Castellaniella sp. TaxID=1955812 RepID=UPI003C75F974
MTIEVAVHQQSWLRTIFSTGKWYLLSSLMTKGLSLILLPVYTRYLTPEEFGILNTLTALGGVLPVFISLQLDAAFARFFHEYKGSQPMLRALYSTIFWFVACYGGCVVLLCLIVSAYSPGWFPDVPYVYLLLTFVPALFLQLGQLGTVFLRQSLDAVRTTSLEVGGALLSALITLVLMIFFDFGVLARLLGIAIPPLFILFYYIQYFKRTGLLAITWRGEILKQAIIYALPLVPSVAGGWITGLSDRLIIAHYVDYDAVGIYSLAASLALAMYVLQDAITQVIGPLAMSGFFTDRERMLENMRRSALQLWILMLAANFLLILFSNEIIAVVSTHAYASASLLLGVISFAYVLGCQYRNFVTIISLHNRTWILTAGGIGQAVLSVVINILFVQHFGIRTAAWALCVATLVFTGWLYYWSWRLERFRLREKEMLFQLVGFSCMVYLYDFFLAERPLSLWMFAEKLVLAGIVIGLALQLIRRV